MAVDSALKFLFSCMTGASSSDEMTNRLKEEYARRKGAGRLFLDDTTVAITSSMAKPSDLDILLQGKPVKVIVGV